MPYKYFVPQQLTAAEVNEYLMNQSVMVFASVAARNSSLTAPTEGMMCYLTDTNKYCGYDGSTWRDIAFLGTRPAFQAYGPVVANTSPTNPVVLTKTYLNIGNCYSTTTGRFTAPVDGLYYITWSFLSQNTNDVYRWYLRKNGSQIGDLHFRADAVATGSEFVVNASKTWLIQLNSGDYLTISFLSDSGNPFYNGGGDEYSNFSAFWIG